MNWLREILYNYTHNPFATNRQFKWPIYYPISRANPAMHARGNDAQNSAFILDLVLFHAP